MEKNLGQYFTVSDMLQKKVCEFVHNCDSKILEPSFGAGHLLKMFMNRKITCYEIDKTIKPIVKFSNNHTVEYTDFLTAYIDEKFGTIIGNPPYVKSRSGNLYIRFIEKCFELLADHGEIVFIVPSDFIKLTHAKKIIQKMCKVGTFTHFYFPNDEKLFENASIDVMVFRYQKTENLNTYVNGTENYYSVRDGMILFSANPNGHPVSDFFDVYVGMVSGKDEVFKNERGNISVLVDENTYEKFVYVDKPTEYLLKYKDVLMERKIKKFDETNWFEWGAPRNKKTIEANKGKKCIYVKTITRNKTVAFEGVVDYFGGTLLCMIPKRDVDINKVIDRLNSEDFKKEFTFSGRFKIGQRQLSCSFIMV